MYGFSIFMFIFAFFLFLAGLYIYTGHNSEVLIWKGYNKNATRDELKAIGRGVWIVAFIIVIIAILGIIFKL